VPSTDLLIASALILLALYAAFVLSLILVGRRSDARALAGFIPDCLVLFKRLLADSRVSPARKLALAVLVAYLALPIDLIPDFIPVAGQFDDAILVALVLRAVLRGGGPSLLEEHWPGPPQGALLIQRLAYGRAASNDDHADGGSPLRRR
jgi:uncharacterized membrane protein YkvA (DUF1232 family)